MGNRVVQFAGQRQSLLSADLAALALPEVSACAEDRCERGDEQKEEAATDEVRRSGRRGIHAESHDRRDARHTHEDLSPRAPADQGVEQDQNDHHRRGAEVFSVGDQLDDGEQPRDTEADEAGGEWVAAAPEEGWHQGHGEQGDVGLPGQIWPSDALDHCGRLEPADEKPVGTAHWPGADGPRLAPDSGPEGSHRFRLGIAGVTCQVQAQRMMHARRTSSRANPRPW